MRTGRNEPCPCGSGRKYKKCCLAKDEAGSRGEDVRWMLAHFALESTPREQLEAAWHEFRDTDEPLDDFLKKPYERTGSFLDWLTKGHRIDGRTALERFEDSQGDELSDDERRELEEVKAMRYGLFEVQEVRPGQGVVLLDLFDGASCFARDISASRQAVQWDLLTAWVAPKDGHVELWGRALMFRPQDKAELKAELRSAYERRRWAEPELSWQGFLNAALPLLERLQTRLTAESRRFFTPEGDPLAACAVDYAVEDFSSALKGLRRCEELRESSSLMGADDRLAEVKFDWLGCLPRAERPRPAGLSITTELRSEDGGERSLCLGDVLLTRTALKLQCLSVRRMEGAKALVEKAVKPRPRLLREEHRPADVLDAHDGGGPSRRSRKMTKVASAALQAVAALDYAEQWLREPVPALEGRTPLDAAKDPEGRALLVELLKIFENHDGREYEGWTAPSAPCRVAMRRLLGMPIPAELEAQDGRLRELARAAPTGDPDEKLLDRFKRAMSLQGQGRTAQALRAYAGLKSDFRAHNMKHQFWANYGTCHLQAGFFQEGIRCLETALEIKPDYEFAVQTLAKARRVRGSRRPRKRPRA